MRVSFLDGSKKDIRTQFIAWDDRPKVPADADRTEYMKLGHHRRKLTALREIVQDKDSGIKA